MFKSFSNLVRTKLFRITKLTLHSENLGVFFCVKFEIRINQISISIIKHLQVS